MSKIQVQPKEDQPKEDQPKDQPREKQISKTRKPNFLRPNFLRHPLVRENEEQKTQSLKLEDVGEDNVGMVQDKTNIQSDQTRNSPSPNDTNEEKAFISQNDESFDNEKRCHIEVTHRRQHSLYRLLLPVLIFLTVLSLIINVLVIRGVVGETNECSCSINDISKGINCLLVTLSYT